MILEAAKLRQQIQKLQQNIRLPAYDYTDGLSTKALLAQKMAELRRLLGQREACQAAVKGNESDEKQIRQSETSIKKVVARQLDPDAMAWSGADC